MSDNEDDIETGNEDEPLSGGGGGPLGEVPESTTMEAVAGAVAGIAVISSVGAIAIMGAASPVVICACAGSACLGPYAWYQQTQLTDIRALKDTHEALHREVETLQAENNRLRKNVDELKGTVNRLQDVEDALETITQTQGQSVAAFAEQVEESRGILSQMEQNYKANILQNLFSVVMQCDADGDLTIDDDEIEDIVDKMSKIKGVKVNQALFRHAIISQGRSIDSVMAIVRNLIEEGNDGRPEEEQIFVLTDTRYESSVENM